MNCTDQVHRQANARVAESGHRPRRVDSFQLALPIRTSEGDRHVDLAGEAEEVDGAHVRADDGMQVRIQTLDGNGGIEEDVTVRISIGQRYEIRAHGYVGQRPRLELLATARRSAQV
jgi:hypothetical protein